MEKELAKEIATDAGLYFYNGYRETLINNLWKQNYTNNRRIDEEIYLLASETLLDYENSQEEGIEYLSELLEGIEL